MAQEPSEAVRKILDYNEDEIYDAAFVSALQAMPICVAQGRQTTLAQETKLLVTSIEDLVRRQIDENEIMPEDSPGIYRVVLGLVTSAGQGIGHRTKNAHRLSIDISVPLKWETLHFHPSDYQRAKVLFNEE